MLYVFQKSTFIITNRYYFKCKKLLTYENGSEFTNYMSMLSTESSINEHHKKLE